ncbi:hypothetical protein [Thiobacillus sp.]
MNNVIQFPGETRWPDPAANDEEMPDSPSTMPSFRERWQRFAEAQPQNARMLPWSLAICIFLIAVRVWG